MPFKVILAKRTTLQQALDKWSDDTGPIKVVSMTQNMDRDGDSVTLVIFYQIGSGVVGAEYSRQAGTGYLRPSENPENNPPALRSDMGKEDEEFGEAPECPQCGAEMVIRRRKADFVPFWGCKEFPTCRGIVNIEEDEKPRQKNGNKKKAKKSEADERQGDLGFGRSDSAFDDGDDIPF